MTDLTPSSSSSSVYQDKFTPGDFTWLLACGFLIFTMQTGFGLLECGIVLQKNETNIMLKNVADIVFGGFSYWLFGYGITYGTWKGSSAVLGIGDYGLDSPTIEGMGDTFTLFFFQLSFATTATTIASGGMAERVNFKAYCLYCFFATITYTVAARWVSSPTGFLSDLGVIDIAGAASVHLVGGSAAIVSAWKLGPRLGRYDFDSDAPPPGNPLNVLIGLFILWWSWLAHNSASSHGVMGDKWKFGARAAMNTAVASIGGGLVGFAWGFLKPGKPLGVLDMVNGVMGSLVSITAGCSIFHTPEAFLTGLIGGLVALGGSFVPDFFKIDDPVSATAVHGFGGIWGMISVALFAVEDQGILGVKVMKGQKGLLRGGSIYLLGVQLLAICCIVVWSMFATFVILSLINLLVSLRVSERQELLGMDFSEHGIHRRQIGLSPTLSVLGSHADLQKMAANVETTGQDSLAHIQIVATLRDLRRQRQNWLRKRSAEEMLRPQLMRMRKMKILFEKIFGKLSIQRTGRHKNSSGGSNSLRVFSRSTLTATPTTIGSNSSSSNLCGKKMRKNKIDALS